MNIPSINTEKVKAYYDMLQLRRNQKRQDELLIEDRLTAFHLKEMEMKRIMINRELNRLGQNMDLFA
jgi:hypothetical protein